MEAPLIDPRHFPSPVLKGLLKGPVKSMLRHQALTGTEAEAEEATNKAPRRAPIPSSGSGFRQSMETDPGL